MEEMTLRRYDTDMKAGVCLLVAILLGSGCSTPSAFNDLRDHYDSGAVRFEQPEPVGFFEVSWNGSGPATVTKNLPGDAARSLRRAVDKPVSEPYVE